MIKDKIKPPTSMEIIENFGKKHEIGTVAGITFIAFHLYSAFDAFNGKKNKEDKN